jgi:hypothetical protein
MFRRRHLLISAIVIGAALVIGVTRLWEPVYLAYALHVANTTKERQILYDLDPYVIAAALRSFALTHGWENPGTFPQYYQKTDQEVPIMLRSLNFSIINVYDDRVDIDFGGAFLSFGLSVFPEGVEGKGTKKLGPGIWFYSEDGGVPRR